MKTNQKRSEADCALSFSLSHELAHQILSDAERNHLTVDQWVVETLEKYLKQTKENNNKEQDPC